MTRDRKDDRKDEAAQAASPSFGEAMGELEGILERIEGEEIDIDRLAEELRRAAHLLDLCRTKIRRAEVEVTQIVQSLEDEPAAGDAPEVEPREAEDADGDGDDFSDDDIPF